MAVFKTLNDRIDNIETAWNGKSGEQIEDFISKNLVGGMSYDNSTLTIYGNETNDDGSKNVLARTQVTVETPVYSQGILSLAVRINGKNSYTTGSVTMQYNSDARVELAVATYYISSTPTAGDVDSTLPVKIKVSYGGKTKTTSVNPYSKSLFTMDGDTPTRININESDYRWVDITDLFKNSATSQITVSLVDYKKSHTLPVTITNQVITLEYVGNIVSNNAQFKINGGVAADYYLEGWNNGSSNKFKTTSGVLTKSDLVAGLNQLAVRAVYNNNKDIATDYIYVDVINSVGLTDTVVAINNTSTKVNNHDTVELYKLTVYSPNKESIKVDTYLDDTSSTPTSLLDSVYVTSQDYDSNKTYETQYSKYIEINRDNGEKYLKVKYNGDYTFYLANGDNIYSDTYRNITVSNVIADYLYTQEITPFINFDQISGRTTTLFNDSPNYWKTESGRVVYSVEALSNKVFNGNGVNLSLANDFTLEFGFKSYNISNEEGSESAVITFGNMQIRPTMVCWNTSAIKDFNARFAQFNEEVDTHIVITVQSNYKINKSDIYYPDYFVTDKQQKAFDDNIQPYNLARIYVNGVITREIKLRDSEVQEFKNAVLQINPKSSDIDLYLLRVYNSTALDFDQVQRNYISFLPTRQEKDKFYDANDIIGTNGAISFTKALGKYNTLVYVFPKGGVLPNRSWQNQNNTAGDQDKVAKKLPCTLFINYKDQDINREYGGRITNGLVKGQGSSAMRYLIWNTTFQLKKIKKDGSPLASVFTPYLNLDQDTNRFTTVRTKELKNAYHMPPYEGQRDSTEKDLNVTKLVGKVNFASSMQSHKEGACKLYNDAFKAKHTLISGGRKTVHEEAFLYFYLITDLNTVDQVELADLIDNDNVKFMGFQTFGSAKGDKATSGYDDDKTPEYIILEGGENADPVVRFLRPWMSLQRKTVTGDSVGLSDFPTITKQESIADSSKNLYIMDESITYDGKNGAWDVDFGLNDSADDFTDSAKVSLEKFRAFYDFVYKYNYNLTISEGTTTDSWDSTKRYVLEGQIDSLTGSKKGDIYRWDEYANNWVKAGLYYDSTNGWERLNIFDDFNETLPGNNIQMAIDALKVAFKEGIKQYVDIEDICFHQAVIKLLSGTDNRAKNTYFQIIGKIYENRGTEGAPGYQPTEKGDYKVRLIGDDLDTIIQTDNNGLQSKPYNLLEPSFDWDTRSQWGDSGMNAFFYMFDQQWETPTSTDLSSIKTELANIIDFGWTSGHNFDKFFFSIQRDKYPAIAYNHTAKIWYETAQFVLDATNRGADIIGGYTNNDIEPIEQSHGSSLEGEELFMKRRKDFLASYAQIGIDGNTYSSDSSGSGSKLQVRLEFEPFQDFYPCYKWGEKVYKYVLQGTPDKKYDAVKYLAKKGQTYTSLIKESGEQINYGFVQIPLYKKFNITGLVFDKIDAPFNRATSFTIDNKNLETYKSFFGDNPHRFSLGSFSANFPVLEELTLNDMNTIETLDLSSCKKLTKLNLSKTTVKRVILPSKVKELVLPETLETFELYNPVESITFEGLNNIQSVDLENVGNLNVNQFLIDITNSANLKSITLRDIDIRVTEETLSKLLVTNFKTTGSITVVDNSNQLAEISFNTKKQLVEIFGDIDSVDNKPKVNYKASSSVATLVYEQEVQAFEVGTTYDLFNVNVTSNQVAIVSDPTPRLSINYSMDSNYNRYIDLDTKTGKITVKDNSYKQAIEITITVNLINGSPITKKSSLSLTWKAPEVGNFVYYDGSYTSSYNENKTLVGMIYAVTDATDEEQGTAYVIGKEYFTNNALYVGYDGSSANINSEVSTLKDLGYIGKWLKTKGKVSSETQNAQEDYHWVTTEQGNHTKNINDIGTSTYTISKNCFKNDYFSGKSDMQNYIDAANSILSDVVSQAGSNSAVGRAITNNSGSYSISSLSNLETIINNFQIPNAAQNAGISSCVVFPYFYAAYLYQPVVKDNETLADSFKQGNWYIPSIDQLSRVIYYRGYSANTNFANSEITSTIKININSGNTVDKKAIFSDALKVMGAGLPEAWRNIANNQNLTSTEGDSTPNSFTYGQTNNTNVSSGVAPIYGWMLGSYTTDTWQTQKQTARAGWRLTKHKGVPFTEFKFSKQ